MSVCLFVNFISLSLILCAFRSAALADCIYNKMLVKTFLILFLTYLISQVSSQCCSQLDSNLCLKCPQGMHLYRNNCIFDIPHCSKYQAGFDCIQCEVNYQLIGSSCQHIRFQIDTEHISDFTLYIQSAIKPNPFFSQALDILSSNTDVWTDWLQESYKQSLQTTNMKTKLKASSLQNRIFNSSSLLHYIYTASYTSSNINLIVFRLTYEVINPPGFADILVAVQAGQSRVKYLQIVQVRLSEVENKGWLLLSPSNVGKIEKMMEELFDGISIQHLLKSWWKFTKNGYNITLFYMDDAVGVISYTYLTKNQDLARLGLQMASKNETSPQNMIQVQKQKKGQDKYPQNASNSKNQTSGKDQSLANKTQKPSEVDKKTDIVPKNETKQQGQANNTLDKSTKQVTQLFLDVNSSIQEETVLAGYAVAFKLQYVPLLSTLEAISHFTQNNTYCLYFKKQQIHYRFIFHINFTNPSLQVLYYVTSNISFIGLNLSNSSNQTYDKTTNKTNLITNSTINQTKTLLQNNTKIMPIPQNQSMINYTISNKTKQENTNSSSNSTTPLNKQNATTNYDCSQPHSVSIDITNQIDKDVYMPKINLLLMNMYSDTLKDSRIGEASYRWAVDSNTQVTSLTYNVTYLCRLNEQYEFQIKIINNQLKFTKVPPNIRQSGSTLTNSTNPKTNNSNSSVPSNLTNKQSSVANQSQKQSSASVSNQETNITAPTNKTDKTSFLQDALKKVESLAKQDAVSSQTKDIQKTETTKEDTKQKIAILNETQSNQSKEGKDGQIRKNIVSMSEFQNNPKYKPVIEISRSIKRIPYNASLQKMQEWEENNQTCYSYKLIMNFSVPLANGSSQKIFSFNVVVNSSNYLNIISCNITYCCVQSSPNNQNSSLISDSESTTETAEKIPAVLKSIWSVDSSPYTDQVVKTLQTHSPALKKLNLLMVSSKIMESSEGRCFVETLKFKGEIKTLCYQVHFCAMNEQNYSQNKVRIRNYRITNCSEQLSNIFLYNLALAKFVKSQEQSQEVYKLISKINKNRQISFIHYLKYQNFYYVSYNDPQSGDVSVLCDATSLTLLSYSQTPQIIYTPSSQSIDKDWMTQVKNKIQENSKDKTKQFEIIYIEKRKLDKANTLIMIYIVQKQVFWGLQIKNLYQIKAKLVQNSVIILEKTLIQSNNPEPTKIKSSQIKAGLFQVPLKSIANNRFNSLMKQISNQYSSFIDSSYLKAILLQNQQCLQHFQDKNWNQSVLVKVIIAKKSSDSSYGSYLINSHLNPNSQVAEIQGIEVINSNIIKATNCNKSSEVVGMCVECNSGYKLVNDSCVEEINDCLEYYDFWCVKCTQSHVIDNLSKCSKFGSIGSEIEDINNYLVAIRQGH